MGKHYKPLGINNQTQRRRSASLANGRGGPLARVPSSAQTIGRAARANLRLIDVFNGGTIIESSQMGNPG